MASLGAGNVGLRSGEQVDLRFYAGVSGIVDTNITLLSWTLKGTCCTSTISMAFWSAGRLRHASLEARRRRPR